MTLKRLYPFFAEALLIFCYCAESYAFSLPATGQTQCYDLNGNLISCTGTGQDAVHISNSMSYTDNGDGTVTDNVTGLMWQKQDDGTQRTWSAAGTYCSTLGDGGHSDWRMPAIMELMGIVNYGNALAPTINTTYFPNTNPYTYYWSSTTYAYLKVPAWWGVDFSDGFAGGYNELYGPSYVRCVRGGQEPPPSFTDNRNGTVSDSTTGLMWQQADPGQMTSFASWTDALSYCTGLVLGGNSDWRLPNIKELASITDVTTSNPAINLTFFPNANSSLYWSSTTLAGNAVYAFTEDFGNGAVAGDSKSDDGNWVRCVRGVESGASGTFPDVPPAEAFYKYIEAIYNAGITNGCGNGDYCPSEDVTRDQMAAFLVRSTQVKAGQSPVTFTCKGGVSCATETPYFNDVPAADQFFTYVQKLKELGITTGCGNGNYCPSGDVTRDQMAAFIIRALYGANYTCTGGVNGASVACGSTTPYFSDVPTTDQFFPYVQKLKELGITTGCGNGDFCPSENVTRDQMAAFLARAFLGMQ